MQTASHIYKHTVVDLASTPRHGSLKVWLLDWAPLHYLLAGDPDVSRCRFGDRDPDASRRCFGERDPDASRRCFGERDPDASRRRFGERDPDASRRRFGDLDPDRDPRL